MEEAMPILTDTSGPSAWIEPDEVPRPVVAYGMISNDVGSLELDPHRHAKGQILFLQRGALSFEVQGGLWIVPPRSAVWIPGGARHSMKATGALEGYSAFVAPHTETHLPSACCTVAVTPLLCELLFRAGNLPVFWEERGANARLMRVLLDEIAAVQIDDLHLPMPTNPRLREMVGLMMATPADRGTLEVWAKRIGLSKRTLLRLMSRETGMSFGRWRQQLGVVLAVKWLAGGASIQQVAIDLGYESVPSFVIMFKKALGTSPGRYMAERYLGRH
jgi:AraC-like DNA-binding protein